MGTITTGFKEYFEGYDLELPEPIPPKGNIEKGGWQVTYILGKDDDDLPYFDFFAEHRMTSPRHVRILHDGSFLSLESYQENYSYDSNVEGDEERAMKAMKEHNDRVSEILKAKGFY